jgi:hypothetical protein
MVLDEHRDGRAADTLDCLQQVPGIEAHVLTGRPPAALDQALDVAVRGVFEPNAHARWQASERDSQLLSGSACQTRFKGREEGRGRHGHPRVLRRTAQDLMIIREVSLYQPGPEFHAWGTKAGIRGTFALLPRCVLWVPVIGKPDMDKVSTSYVERQNLTMRMSMRRLTRLTNAFSKKWENMEKALALHFAYYNFCRVHQSLRVTPAMEAGIADHIWTLDELIGATF